MPKAACLHEAQLQESNTPCTGDAVMNTRLPRGSFGEQTCPSKYKLGARSTPPCRVRYALFFQTLPEGGGAIARARTRAAAAEGAAPEALAGARELELALGRVDVALDAEAAHARQLAAEPGALAVAGDRATRRPAQHGRQVHARQQRRLGRHRHAGLRQRLVNTPWRHMNAINTDSIACCEAVMLVVTMEVTAMRQPPWWRAHAGQG